MKIEKVILQSLVNNENYARKTLPYIKDRFFEDRHEQIVFKEIRKFINKYNALPTKEALVLAVEKLPSTEVSDDDYETCAKIISLLDKDEQDINWLVDSTEKWCQERAIYIAITASVKILQNKDKKHEKGKIPEMLSEALGVSFDPNIGHDFLEDSDDRFEFYHKVEEKVAFDLEMFNKITKGGFNKKTLNILMAGTGTGKSLFMCHFASANLLDGKNVLYITMEMAEERIAERIDANLLDVTVDDLKLLQKDIYDKKIERVKGKTSGKLIIKEYPTATAGTSHFRHLLNELKLKKSFVPDIIYVDYLNICSSSRVRADNMYNYIKSIAEEMRGLAVEFNIPIVSATQTNRDGIDNSDFGLKNTSESMGLPHTIDFMVAIISNEELAELSQFKIKQLKNRYEDINKNKGFVVGVDRPKMRLYDSEPSAQEGLSDGPAQNANTSFLSKKIDKDATKDFTF